MTDLRPDETPEERARREAAELKRLDRQSWAVAISGVVFLLLVFFGILWYLRNC